MKKKPEHLPVIIGVAMLFVVLLTSGGLIVSFVSSDIVQQHSEDSETSEDLNPENQSEASELEASESESDITVAPRPPASQGGGMTGIDTSSSSQTSQTNIAPETYSNPPSSINSSQSSYESSELSQQDSSMSNFGSSVERNRLIQENISRSSSDSSSSSLSIPDYSSPSSSNNFNQTSNQSLIEPTENNSLLEEPDDSLEPIDDSEESDLGITSEPTTNTTTTTPLEQLP